MRAPTNFSINVDIADEKACEDAVARLYDAIAARHGRAAATSMFIRQQYGPHWQNDAKIEFACRLLPPEKLRVALLYYAMPNRSKRGLAKILAGESKNQGTMLTLVKNVLRHKPECAIIAQLTLKQREEALRRAEASCLIRKRLRESGIGPKQWRRIIEEVKNPDGRGLNEC